MHLRKIVTLFSFSVIFAMGCGPAGQVAPDSGDAITEEQAKQDAQDLQDSELANRRAEEGSKKKR